MSKNKSVTWGMSHNKMMDSSNDAPVFQMRISFSDVRQGEVAGWQGRRKTCCVLFFSGLIYIHGTESVGKLNICSPTVFLFAGLERRVALGLGLGLGHIREHICCVWMFLLEDHVLRCLCFVFSSLPWFDNDRSKNGIKVDMEWVVETMDDG